jgi:hypothetical protein
MTFPTVDPLKYLEFAREVSSRTETEARRTAGDRAYYAAFLFARDQLALKRYIEPLYREQDKHDVSRKLKELKFGIGNSVHLLRQRRTRVTYDTREVVSSSLGWMIDTAQKIIDYVKSLPVNPNIKSQ